MFTLKPKLEKSQQYLIDMLLTRLEGDKIIRISLGTENIRDIFPFWYGFAIGICMLPDFVAVSCYFKKPSLSPAANQGIAIF